MKGWRNAFIFLAFLIWLQLVIAALLVAWGIGSMVAFVVLISLLMGTFVVTTVYSIVFGAPFVPIDHSRVSRMLEMTQLKPGERLADLGSGDGRIVIAAAKAGAYAEGWEISPFLWAYSCLQIWRYGLQGRAKVHLRSYWPDDMSRFDVVTLFLIVSQMPRMEKKLRAELPAHARVASYAFRFPTWQEEQKTDGIRLYRQQS